MKKNVAAPVALVIIALTAGVFLYQSRQLDAPTEPPSAQAPDAGPNVPSAEPPTPADQPGTTVAIYRVDPGDEQQEPRLVRFNVQIPGGTEPMAAALNAMAQEKESPLPNGTRARSVKLTEDVAHVDFNGQFKGNFLGGDSEEALAINSVLATLAQFPGVKRVRITQEGKTIESLGGHFDLTQPLSVRDAALAVGNEGPQTAQGGLPLGGGAQ